MPANPMISENWVRFLLPIVRKEWDQNMRLVPSPFAPLMGGGNSTSPVEYSQGVGGFGLVPEYNSSEAEGDPAVIQYDSFNPLFEATFTHKEYALGVSIERKLWDDNQSGLIRRKASALGMSFGTTRAVHASSMLNNAFSTSHVGADEVALCSASHPVSPTDTTVVSNAGGTALSYAAIVNTLIAGASMQDDRGAPMPIIYDVLYVPIALQSKAFELIQAIGKPGTADNDANFLASRGLRVVVDPYLTSAKSWFMIDSMQSKLHALWFDRVRPELTMDPASDFNLVAKYRGYMRYSFGWDDFRFIFGHNVA